MVADELQPFLTHAGDFDLTQYPISDVFQTLVGCPHDLIILDNNQEICSTTRAEIRQSARDSNVMLIVVGDDKTGAYHAIRMHCLDYLIRPLTRENVARAFQQARQRIVQSRLYHQLHPSASRRGTSTAASALHTHIPKPLHTVVHPHSGDGVPAGMEEGISDISTLGQQDASNVEMTPTGLCTPGDKSVQETAVPSDYNSESANAAGPTVTDASTEAEEQWSDPNRIVIRDSNGISFVKFSDIVRLESSGSYVKVRTCEDVHLVRSSLKDLTGRLPSYFFRVHRSHTVNLDRVHCIQQYKRGSYQITMCDGEKVSMSRHRIEDLEEYLGTSI